MDIIENQKLDINWIVFTDKVKRELIDSCDSAYLDPNSDPTTNNVWVAYLDRNSLNVRLCYLSRFSRVFITTDGHRLDDIGMDNVKYIAKYTIPNPPTTLPKPEVKWIRFNSSIFLPDNMYWIKLKDGRVGLGEYGTFSFIRYIDLEYSNNIDSQVEYYAEIQKPE